MDSSSPDALRNLYAGWMAITHANPDMELERVRDLFEHWGDVTAEPRGVDYVEDEIGGIEAMWALPKQRSDEPILLCFHGGGYVLGSMYSHRKLYGHFAKAARCRALILNYRRAPENLHPGPVEDCVTAYRALLEGGGAAAAKIAFLGDSAGGTLAISAALLARDKGLPMPAACLAMAPYMDLEATGSTYETNAELDALGDRDATIAFGRVFLGPDGSTSDPLVNPVLADLRGLPPMLLQTGGHDVLLDDSRNFAEAASAAGTDVTLEVAPGMQHVYHFLAGTDPQADASITRAAAWLRGKLGLTGLD
jgi:monoterpene epsilon-lactone hydrolase